MPHFRFALRSLFILMTVVAMLTLPVLEYSIKTLEAWNQKDDIETTVTLPAFTVTPVNQVISVPDGGIVVR